MGIVENFGNEGTGLKKKSWLETKKKKAQYVCNGAWQNASSGVLGHTGVDIVFSGLLRLARHLHF